MLAGVFADPTMEVKVGGGTVLPVEASTRATDIVVAVTIGIIVVAIIGGI